LYAVEAVINGQPVDDDTIAKAEAATCAASTRGTISMPAPAYRRALVGTMIKRALKATRAL